jgi:MFS transporter, UMF1 family
MQILKKYISAASAWAFYDWANSVYPLIISTAIFPIYYEQVTPDTLVLWGLSFRNTELYTYALSVSFLLVAIFSPLLSGLSDFLHDKKRFMRWFCYLGAISCSLLYFFSDLYVQGYLALGLLLVILASLGYWGSVVFYNAYLPELVPKHQQDVVSAQGYAWGYVGSVLLLTACLTVITSYGTEWTAHCFLAVGVWWALFAQVTFYILPHNKVRLEKAPKGAWKEGYKRLLVVLDQTVHTPMIRYFLYAFFFYNMGVQTLMLVATIFAQKELTIPTSGLITSVLLIQIVALFGAFLFAKISKLFGNITSLSLTLLIWISICLMGYFYLDPLEPLEVRAQRFYITAALVGLVMGGTQSLSRSTYAKLLPETENHASYFSLYDVTEKISIVFGTFAWAFLEGITGDMRLGILALAIYFILGLILLLRVNNRYFLQIQEK